MSDSYKEIEEFFDAAPTINQKAWGIIHDFYHLVLTHMKQNNITNADLAKRLNKSKSSISRMFDKNPNVSIKKLVEIADAVDLDISIIPTKEKDNIMSKENTKCTCHEDARKLGYYMPSCPIHDPRGNK